MAPNTDSPDKPAETTHFGYRNVPADEKADLVKGVFDSVAGRYDLVALVRVTKNEELADVISDKMRHLEGIVETETMIAFRAYSKQELEAGFELGLD
jgi:DNA-binding Lrp family transcriptional regulator